jgi:membrane fusion protein, multidrug efflux system
MIAMLARKDAATLFSTFQPSCFDQHASIPDHRQPGGHRAATAPGLILEVAAQANPITQTFGVKLGLTDPPPAMRLGQPSPDAWKRCCCRSSTSQRCGSSVHRPKTVSIRKVDALRFDKARAVV